MYVPSRAVFPPQWRSWAVAIETRHGAWGLKYMCPGLLQEKFSSLCPAVLSPHTHPSEMAIRSFSSPAYSPPVVSRAIRKNLRSLSHLQSHRWSHPCWCHWSCLSSLMPTRLLQQLFLDHLLLLTPTLGPLHVPSSQSGIVSPLLAPSHRIGLRFECHLLRKAFSEYWSQRRIAPVTIPSPSPVFLLACLTN